MRLKSGFCYYNIILEPDLFIVKRNYFSLLEAKKSKMEWPPSNPVRAIAYCPKFCLGSLAIFFQSHYWCHGPASIPS